MYKKNTSSLFATSLILSLATASMPAVAAVINADWIIGSGNYSNDTKWNIPAVPCNAGTTTFNVTIPASSGTVNMDVSPSLPPPSPPDKCTVDTLTLGANSTFSVLSGNSYTVLGLADIAGIVRGNGGDFLAPVAAFSGNTARASASGGATVQIGAPSYLATGLISATLFSSTGTGSILNLSTLQSINSSFNDNSGVVRANSITASSDASLDLSGVTAITAPARGEDRLDINVSDTAVIDLSSLATISGGGQTRFVVTDGGVQLLPALQTVSRGRFDVGSGGQLSTAGSAWTYINQLASIPMFNVSGTGSVLDLSTLQSINSSFNDNSGVVRANSITSSSDASLDLSGVTTITAPARGEDRLDFVVNDGELRIGAMDKASGGGAIRMLLNDSLSLLVAPASFKPHTKISITAVADATVMIGKDYSFKHTNENSINLESAVVKFDGTNPQFVEAGGFDISTLTPIGPNFGFGQMIIGTDLQATTVYLRDGVNNGNGHVLCGPGEEALYLLGLPADPANPDKIVSGLRILGGSTLVLNGIPLYVMQDGFLQDVRDWFPAGQRLITYGLNNSNGFIDLGSSPHTDADADGVIDDGLIGDVLVQDNCALVSNADQRDTNGDGYGNMCDPDLNNDLVVQAADLAIFKPLFFSTDPDADFDGNGRVQAGDLAILKKFFFQPPGPSCVVP